MQYVYAHINPINGRIFYIGKGNKSRTKSKGFRNEKWHEKVTEIAAAGQKFEVVIMHECSCPQEALMLEDLEIKKEAPNGYLVNLVLNPHRDEELTRRTEKSELSQAQRILDALSRGPIEGMMNLYEASQVRKKVFLRELQQLIDVGRVNRTGEGKPRKPYKYELAG